MPQLCTSRAGCNPDLAFAHLRRQGDAGGEDQALAGISGGGRGARRARARERPWPTDGHARAFSALGDRREADGVGVVNVAAPRPEFVRIRNHAPAAATQREGAAEPPGGAHIRVRRLLNARGGPSGRRSRAPRAAPLRRRTTRRAIPKGSWSFTTGASGADKLPRRQLRPPRDRRRRRARRPRAAEPAPQFPASARPPPLCTAATAKARSRKITLTPAIHPRKLRYRSRARDKDQPRQFVSTHLDVFGAKQLRLLSFRAHKPDI